jgi:D-alanyl-lipoteichoic acid acyltransferase DltB (MBOAT superfamily)
MMPIGFSFYILQLAGYLFDLRAGRIVVQHDLLDFALYLAYFPKLLSGPVERGRDFLSRLQTLSRPKGAEMRQGLRWLLLGLFRKVAIADTLLWLFPKNLFATPTEFSFVERLGWLLVFAFRLYNDFAGYTDMMRGLSQLIGLPLGLNFRQPFAARSFSEFWNRWHISLSAWLRDFIFYPLSRGLARRSWGAGWLRVVLPPLLTMLFSGFWHGASLAMLAWGGLHGVFLILEQMGQRLAGRCPRWLEQALFAPSRLRTQLVVLLLWVPFAAGDWGWALRFWQMLLPPYGVLSLPQGWFWPLLLVMVSLGLDWAEGQRAFEHWPRPIQAATVGLGLVLVVLSFGVGLDVSGFVYQGF